MARDFNNDGKLDLVSFSSGSSLSLIFLLGNGDGSFQSYYHSLEGPEGNNPNIHPLFIGDINRDGRPDLVEGNKVPYQLSIYFNSNINCAYGAFKPTIYPTGASQNIWQPATSIMIPNLTWPGRTKAATRSASGWGMAMALLKPPRTIQLETSRWRQQSVILIMTANPTWLLPIATAPR